MKGLIFSQMPVDYEARKRQEPSTTIIDGSTVFMNQVPKALLTYGTYDLYCFFAPTHWSSSALNVPGIPAPQQDRVRTVTGATLSSISFPDRLVVMSPHPALTCALPLRSFIKRPDAPVVGVQHAVSHVHHISSLATLLIEPAREYDALICSSQAGKRAIEQLLRMIAERTAAYYGLPLRPAFQLPVIPLGVSTEEFRGLSRTEARNLANLPQDKVVILYFGRLDTANKCDLRPIILLFGNCSGDWARDSILVLSGDDTRLRLASQLEEFAARSGCSAQIIVRANPTAEEKRLLYLAADIFVSPSDNLQETFGITLIEAMAAGLPVIAADWSGYKEIVAHGSTGFLAPTCLPDFGDAVDIMNASTLRIRDTLLAQTTSMDLRAFQHYLQLLVEDASLRATMGARARETAIEKYDWSVIVRQYESLWDELIERARAASPVPLDDVGHGLWAYPYPAVFGHYPTRLLADNDCLELNCERLSEICDWGLFRSVCEPSDDAGRIRIFEAPIFDAITGFLKGEGPASLRTLAEKIAANNSASDFVIRAHVGRLLKFGAIQLSDSRK
jgi:glycosyltransferase involved in cell wall biosynthesis